MEDLSFTVTEWLNIAVRWTHIFAAIMWVGQTYFFTWLDGRFTELLDTAKASAKASGDKHVWMVHSGGFYLVDKQKRPTLMPTTLHWFRWEAMITWLSGLTLLTIVYYHGGLMADEDGRSLPAILWGVGALVFSWPIYDAIWKSKLSQNEPLAVGICYLALVGLSYLLAHVMDGRAAYIHVGAAMGTIMTINVWQLILPAQRKMVKALNEGKEPDLNLGEQAKARSKHNTFMAVPVVFIMISNHYPVTSYGGDWNWIILSLMILVGWIAAKFIRKA